jgi:hypothetical protein
MRLRGAARQSVAVALRCSGLPWLVRKALGRNRACVVIYHAPAPDVLDRHLAYLARSFHFLPLGALVDAIHARDWSAIPPRALVVTLDDGHRSNADLLPVFRKYGVRPRSTYALVADPAPLGSGSRLAVTYRPCQAERLRKVRRDGLSADHDYPASRGSAQRRGDPCHAALGGLPVPQSLPSHPDHLH